MNPLVRNTLMAAALASAFLAWTLVSRHHIAPPAAPTRTPPAPAYKDFEGTDALTSVTILRFYAATGVLNEGDKATICYGVAKARTVRLDPPVEQLSPSLNRCFQVGPVRDTRYTLTAVGEDGRTTAESFLIQVRPDPLTLPKINQFVSEKKGAPGESVFSLCFSVENAGRVSVDPPVVPVLEGTPRGCFYVAPTQTTTYTLTVTSRRGRTVSRQLTVEVP